MSIDIAAVPVTSGATGAMRLAPIGNVRRRGAERRDR
jgi:hypothetical protein